MAASTKAPEQPKPAETPAEQTKAEQPSKAEEPSDAEELATEAPKAELPSQLKTVHSSPAPRNAPISQPNDVPKDEREREKLLDDAIIFLETGAVRDAPVKEKQAFLQTKGLTAAEARELIGKVNGSKRKDKGKRVSRRSSFSERGTPPASPTPTQTTTPAQTNPPPPQPVPQFQQHAPTILTYPEWLAPPPPPGPRPLMSGATLVNSLYLGAATAATVYGANKFIVTPMLDALTEARLDLSATVKKNLDELNERLLELAPASYVARKGLIRVREEDEESEASSDVFSDPSELFHVDAQTQTCPSLDGHDDDEMGTGALTPDSKLEVLTSQMKVLVESHSDGTDNELTFLLEDLTSYLEGLTYDSAVSSNIYTSPFGVYSGQADSSKDDPIAKVKQEIRSVKGVLLNTKNFPASR